MPSGLLAPTAEGAIADAGGGEGSNAGSDGDGESAPPASSPPSSSAPGTTEFSLALIDGKTPAELTSDTALAQDPTIAGYKSIDDLMRSHVAAQKMVGNPNAFVKLPTEGATDEERAEFFSKIGRPESPDGYQFADPEGLPEGAPPVSDDFVSAFRQQAHEVGVTGEQAQKLYQWFRQSEVGAHQQLAEQRGAAQAEATNALKQEWGAAFTHKLQQAESVLGDLPETLAAKLVATGLNNDADVIRMLAEVADARGEDVDPRRGEGGNGPMTPGQALAERNRLSGDESFQKAYLDKMHPGHQDAVNKMNQLAQLAWPEQGG